MSSRHACFSDHFVISLPGLRGLSKEWNRAWQRVGKSVSWTRLHGLDPHPLVTRGGGGGGRLGGRAAWADPHPPGCKPASALQTSCGMLPASTHRQTSRQAVLPTALAVSQLCQPILAKPCRSV